MEFSQIVKGSKPGAVHRLELKDPTKQDGDPVMNGKAPIAVMYRKASDMESQKALRRIKRDRIVARHKERIPKEVMEALTQAEVDAMRTIWDVQDDLCDVAKAVIVGFENVQREDKDLEPTDDDIDWFFSLTPFRVEPEKDESGEPVLDESGEQKFATNNPFAKQVAEAATKWDDALGNGKKG